MGITRGFCDYNRPLTREERCDVKQAALEGRAVQKLSVVLYLYTGLHPHDGAHIREYMIQPAENGLNIDLSPGTHTCQVADSTGNIIRDWSKQKVRPCSKCNSGSGGYEFDSLRTVPVRDKDAVRIIESWFEIYDRTPHIQTIRRHVSAIGEAAGVPRLTPIALRHSYGVILAEKRFTRDQIGTIMGYKSDPTLGSRFSLRILDYGKFAKGDNPYYCGAMTSDETRCKKGSPVGEKCHLHKKDHVCGAETLDGRDCRRVVSESGEQCNLHRK